jgi:hypothetical protein
MSTGAKRLLVVFSIVTGSVQPVLAMGGGDVGGHTMSVQYCTEQVVNAGITDVTKFNAEVQKCIANPVTYSANVCPAACRRFALSSAISRHSHPACVSQLRVRRADIALPDLHMALAQCERRRDFSKPCGARFTDLAARAVRNRQEPHRLAQAGAEALDATTAPKPIGRLASASMRPVPTRW